MEHDTIRGMLLEEWLGYTVLLTVLIKVRNEVLILSLKLQFEGTSTTSAPSNPCRRSWKTSTAPGPKVFTKSKGTRVDGPTSLTLFPRARCAHTLLRATTVNGAHHPTNANGETLRFLVSARRRLV